MKRRVRAGVKEREGNCTNKQKMLQAKRDKREKERAKDDCETRNERLMMMMTLKYDDDDRW